MNDKTMHKIPLKNKRITDIHKSNKNICRVIEAYIKAEERIHKVYGGNLNFDPLWIRPVPNTNVKLILSYDKEFMVFKMRYSGIKGSHSETVLSKDPSQLRSDFVKHVVTLFIKGVYQYKFDNLSDLLDGLSQPMKKLNRYKSQLEIESLMNLSENKEGN